ncbi:plasmid mobilization protein [Salinibacter altiplanensis]|uniref:plasmid mobilization protein n=1 Tax=Salinibacter altiplanensis TaxID=1803181 RepID=UPI001319F04F|nr:hypothetical protein [Salinibacter altiplanensis]
MSTGGPPSGGPPNSSFTESPEEDFEESHTQTGDGPAESSSGGGGSSGGGRSGGRPPKPESERRTISHGLYLSEQEKREIRKRADEAGVSINEYLRRRALGPSVQPEERRVTRRKLTEVGTEIKKIRKKVEEATFLTEVEETLRSALEDLTALISEMK